MFFKVVEFYDDGLYYTCVMIPLDVIEYSGEATWRRGTLAHCCFFGVCVCVSWQGLIGILDGGDYVW